MGISAVKKHPRTRALLRLMKRHKLRQQDVAKHCGCARNTVSYWTKENPVIPDNRLRLLKFQLGA